MCYTYIKQIEVPRQKVFYRVVRSFAKTTPLSSIYTNVPLIPGIPMKATNVKPNLSTSHSFIHSFTGWGVFARHHQAVTYRGYTDTNLKIVKVRCEDNPRVAVINHGVSIKCYLFNTITILNGGEPV